ncbi:hypothetical protein BJV74DRAFT_267609 [Russula compacta]|nr:hypothetical protein BJV74DRAFT_267609 [Russula compacta]
MSTKNSLVASGVILGLCILCTQAQSPAPGYAVTCFCDSLQFQENVASCISKTCNPTDTPAASEYIIALCSISPSAGSATNSSSDSPSSTTKASPNSANTLVMHTMAILGGWLAVILVTITR